MEVYQAPQLISNTQDGEKHHYGMFDVYRKKDVDKLKKENEELRRSLKIIRNDNYLEVDPKVLNTISELLKDKE